MLMFFSDIYLKNILKTMHYFPLLQNFERFSVGPVDKTTIKYNKICGCNVTKCETIQVE